MILARLLNWWRSLRPTARLAVRIAAWLALVILYAIAFHYGKKYEAEMLTDAGTSNGDTRRIHVKEVGLGH